MLYYSSQKFIRNNDSLFLNIPKKSNLLSSLQILNVYKFDCSFSFRTITATSLRCYTNCEHQDSHKRGYFPGFFYVWYNPMSILNILSFAEVRKSLELQWTPMKKQVWSFTLKIIKSWDLMRYQWGYICLKVKVKSYNW